MIYLLSNVIMVKNNVSLAQHSKMILDGHAFGLTTSIAIDK